MITFPFTPDIEPKYFWPVIRRAFHPKPIERSDSVPSRQGKRTKHLATPSKFVAVKRLQQIKTDNYVGADGQECDAETVDRLINEKGDRLGDQLVRDHIAKLPPF